MPLDRSFVERNRASSNRIRDMARLSDEALRTPVGQHWTVAIVLAHLTWWDRRVMQVLELTEKAGAPTIPELDDFVNDLSLPLWAAVPPREAARIALETAGALDSRLERFPAALLEALYADDERWVVRAVHRDEHLDEADAALRG